MFTNLLVNRVLPENDSALLLQGLAIVLVVVAGVAAAQYLQTMMMLRIESITDLEVANRRVRPRDALTDAICLAIHHW